MRKSRKIVFVLRLVGRVSVSISLAKYNIFSSADNGCSCEKKNFWQSDLLMPSVSTVEIWSTLTYTELYRDLLIVLPMREPSIFRGIAVSLLQPVIGSNVDVVALNWFAHVRKQFAAAFK